MKTRNLFLILFSMASISVSAQPFAHIPDERDVAFHSQQTIQSTQTMHLMSNYGGTIYTPFSNDVPSDYYNPSGSEQELPQTGPRKLGGGTDPGEQDEDYPIGDPWVLVLFALAFGEHAVDFAFYHNSEHIFNSCVVMESRS